MFNPFNDNACDMIYYDDVFQEEKMVLRNRLI